MIAFKDIEISDKDTITKFTMKSNRRNCDLSFSNLCSWRFLYDTQFAIVDGFLVFKFWVEGELAYMMPVGAFYCNRYGGFIHTDVHGDDDVTTCYDFFTI